MFQFDGKQAIFGTVVRLAVAVRESSWKFGDSGHFAGPIRKLEVVIGDLSPSRPGGSQRNTRSLASASAPSGGRRRGWASGGRDAERFDPVVRDQHFVRPATGRHRRTDLSPTDIAGNVSGAI